MNVPIDGYYEKTQSEGETKTLEDIQITKNYDSSTWIRIGFVSIESGKTLCIPEAYLADEESFKKTNSVQRSNEYIKKQFASM